MWTGGTRRWAESGRVALMARGDAPTVSAVDDALWAALRPVLAVGKPRKKPGTAPPGYVFPCRLSGNGPR